MSLFTPLTGILGGALIGGSAGALLVLNGDIMGTSGIINSSLGKPKEWLTDPKTHWRWVYLASFSLMVNVYVNYLTPEVAHKDERTAAGHVPSPSTFGYILGGFLVGLGTRISNGCTTGHSICGLGRLSPRSLAATVTFTGMAVVTTFAIGPARAWSSLTEFLHVSGEPVVSPLASALVTASLSMLAITRPVENVDEVESKKSFGAAISGALFAIGLALSGMTTNSKVHDFLCFSNLATMSHDPTLMAVMVSGIASSWFSYQFVKGHSIIAKGAECPVALPKGSKFGVPANRKIDKRLIIGSTIFGVGWGITGICPGPALYAAAAGVVDVIIFWFPSFIVGSKVGEQIVAEVWEKKPKKI